jgi:hypothetical protein
MNGTGAIILSSFGVVWALAGARSLERRWFILCLLFSVVASASIVFAALHVRPGPPQTFTFNPRVYKVSVILELVFIALAVVVLRTASRKHLLLPVIALIVGLHFVGMVWALGSNLYWWTGGAMCLLALASMLALPKNAWAPFIGLGSAVILWLSALSAFF